VLHRLAVALHRDDAGRKGGAIDGGERRPPAEPAEDRKNDDVADQPQLAIVAG
jgi:hypothetical protein